MGRGADNGEGERRESEGRSQGGPELSLLKNTPQRKELELVVIPCYHSQWSSFATAISTFLVSQRRMLDESLDATSLAKFWDHDGDRVVRLNVC